MNEELKNKLTERFDSAYGEEVKIGLRDALRKVYLDGVEHGYQYALQHPHWIPVEERLPQDDEKCLIYSDGMVDFGQYNSKTKYWLSEYSGQPTHWMPLPAAPRKED